MDIIWEGICYNTGRTQVHAFKTPLITLGWGKEKNDALYSRYSYKESPSQKLNYSHSLQSPHHHTEDKCEALLSVF